MFRATSAPMASVAGDVVGFQRHADALLHTPTRTGRVCWAPSQRRPSTLTSTGFVKVRSRTMATARPRPSLRESRVGLTLVPRVVCAPALGESCTRPCTRAGSPTSRKARPGSAGCGVSRPTRPSAKSSAPGSSRVRFTARSRTGTLYAAPSLPSFPLTRPLPLMLTTASA